MSDPSSQLHAGTLQQGRKLKLDLRFDLLVMEMMEQIEVQLKSISQLEGLCLSDRVSPVADVLSAEKSWCCAGAHA